MRVFYHQPFASTHSPSLEYSSKLMFISPVEYYRGTVGHMIHVHEGTLPLALEAFACRKPGECCSKVCTP